MDRRNFIRLTAVGGGAVFMSGLFDEAGAADAPEHGFKGDVNPDADVTLKKAVSAVNALRKPPDFIMFTGDLTHTTDDPAERRRRMEEFKDIVSHLKVKTVRFIPGEHDASLDSGTAFKELFGETHYSFDHKGVHFITLDNVSDPGARLGDEQLAWLESDLAKHDRNARIVVFTHRPLFDLAPKWDWATRDGDRAVALLMPYQRLTVFYGHIHQEHHHQTGHIAHHAARSLIFPLPAPGSRDKRTPLPWNAAAPYRGLGFRDVELEAQPPQVKIVELPVVGT
jgi:hypothetical protein